MDSSVFTSILGCLVTKHLVWCCEGIRLDHVQLRIFSSSTVDVLTFLSWPDRKRIIASCIQQKVRRKNYICIDIFQAVEGTMFL